MWKWMCLRSSIMFRRAGTEAALLNTHMRWCFHSDSSSGSHLSWQSPTVQPVPQRSSEKRRRDRNRKRGTRQGQGETAYVRSRVSALYNVTSAELALCPYIIKGGQGKKKRGKDRIRIIRTSDETMWRGRQEAQCAVSTWEPITTLATLWHFQILPWVTLLANSPATQMVPKHS